MEPYWRLNGGFSPSESTIWNNLHNNSDSPNSNRNKEEHDEEGDEEEGDEEEVRDYSHSSTVGAADVTLHQHQYNGRPNNFILPWQFHSPPECFSLAPQWNPLFKAEIKTAPTGMFYFSLLICLIPLASFCKIVSELISCILLL